MDSPLCQRLKNLLLDQENNKISIEPKLFRTSQERGRMQARVAQLEKEIQQARAEAQVGRTAARMGLPGVGVAITTGLHSQIRLSLLEDELAGAKRTLFQVETETDDLANELNNLERNIPTTRAHLLQNDCR